MNIDKKIAASIAPILNQRWDLVPFGYWLEFVNFEWVRGPQITGFKLNTAPSGIGGSPVIQHDVLRNSSSQAAELTTSFEVAKGRSESVEISDTHAFEIGATVSIGYESPIGISVGAEINTSYSYERGQVKGHSIDTTRTSSTSYKVNVAPKTAAKIEVISTENKIEDNWTADLDLSEAQVIANLKAYTWISTALYDGPKQTGEMHSTEGDKSVADFGVLNDRFSSARLQGKGDLIVYPEKHFQGEPKTFHVDCVTRNIDDFGGRAWDNQIGSMRQANSGITLDIRPLINLRDVIPAQELKIPVSGRYVGHGVRSQAMLTDWPLELKE